MRPGGLEPPTNSLEGVRKAPPGDPRRQQPAGVQLAARMGDAEP